MFSPSPYLSASPVLSRMPSRYEASRSSSFLSHFNVFLSPPSIVPRLRLFTALLTRPPVHSHKGIGGSISAPALHALEQQARNQLASIFGLVLRYATADELVCAPGNLIIDNILPDSAAARSGMLQVRSTSTHANDLLLSSTRLARVLAQTHRRTTLVLGLAHLA